MNILPQIIIGEIGKSLGFKMWSERDLTKEYSFPGGRGNEDHGDDFIDGRIIEHNGIYLLVFKNKGLYHCMESLYTLNLTTFNPTKNSQIKTMLSDELKTKIKNNIKLPKKLICNPNFELGKYKLK